MDEPSHRVLESDAPDTTRAIARAVADLLQEGDVVALSGELGAGKTCFVQGAADGLGVTDRITSPTFVLVKYYRGRLPVVHTDVYRLENLRDVDDLGDEVMGPDNVTFVEWGDAVRPLLPSDVLEVELLLEGDPAQDRPDEEPRRRIVLRGAGSWTSRWPRLVEVTAPWAVERGAAADANGTD